MSIREYHYSYS